MTFLFLPVLGEAAPLKPQLAKENPPFTVTAEQIEYDQLSAQILAKGNVQVTFEAGTITADEMRYERGNRVLYAEKAFRLERADQSFSGRDLTYHFDSASGEAKAVDLRALDIFFYGETVSFSSREARLKEASLTSCDLSHPHYHIQAQEVVVYPKTGLAIATWGLLYLSDLPVMIVPTYVYLYQPEGRKGSAPLPVLGSNEEDGFYLQQNIDYSQHDKSYGRVETAYRSRRGDIGLGVHHQLNFDAGGALELRAFGSTQSGSWGGGTFHYVINYDESVDLPMHRYFNHPSYALGVHPYVRADIWSRERINFERVSYFPHVTVSWPAVSYERWPWLQLYLKEGVGSVVEERASLARTRLLNHARLQSEVFRTQSFDVDFVLEHTGRYYEGREHWLENKWFVSTQERWTSFWETGVTYTDFFQGSGGSPFRFESYQYFPFDEVRFDTTVRLPNDFRVGAAYAYNVEKGTYNEMDYSLARVFHCFEISVLYRQIRREFSFGVSLIAP